MTGRDGQRPLRIGEVAEATGTTPRTIRYYEEIGLLPSPAGHEAGRHRLYDEDSVDRIRELVRLKELLGLTLEELKDLVAAEDARAALRREWHRGVEDPVRRRQILEEALGHLSRQLDLVRRRGDEIARLDDELTTRRKRVRARLRELERGKSAAPSRRPRSGQAGRRRAASAKR